MMSVPVTSQVGMSVLVVHLIEWMKSKKWCPWITEQSATINRAVAFVAAFLTSAGFAAVLVGDAHSGGQITITFPALSLGAVGAILSRMMFQGGVQQLYYKLGVKQAPEPPAPAKPAEASK